ncbi:MULTISPECIES: helix-turn-helix domain-containing protein [unclassified Streptomyces]|uniref:winged helix-turn-helix transcriptional regulator n=1 Tax=unclassified Streptomyces TaxID=2593676 RepID=UPI002DD81908|nr:MULTISPECIES: helix-turn-helix domain-containing protein [unclassified Streptomyces]WSA94938.1 helix-turn-helix transcriptional regulator [Streptomyces sp. NBC_01795]WSB79358.1 helix-turn-helix transcriptional regulator [Streptomyces sp. NBC_01775]WSS12436.1 helix-turn-helix transcriptional regulator [Streptomyces sp. NBC_01186]WSS41223.1 helix-turn-helix transcriptional regulator [Streptomyces sp. NBC_01187]
MVTRTRFDDSECPVARSVDAIGDWWSLLIVRDAFDGSRRFGEFQRSLGVAKNILIARLRTLVAGGVLESVPASDGSAYREYVLTPKGEALFPVIVALRQWGEQNFFAPGEPHSQLVDRQQGHRLRALEVLSADGRRLNPDDTTVHKISPQ